METITKNDDVSIKITTPKEEVITMVDLKQKYSDAVQSLTDWEVWVSDEREARQKIVDEAFARIEEAGRLGITEVAEAIPVDLKP